MPAPILLEIVDYRATWPEEFRQLAGKLRHVLGPLAQRIDHIGSTSVHGLAAKDVIDIQITVAALTDEVLHRLTALGYQQVPQIRGDHLPPGENDAPEQWEKWFFRPPPGQRPTNSHVRIAGRANQRYALLFRDFLRANSGMATAYGQLKRRLATSLRDPDDYPDVKDPAVDLIYLAAQSWAAILPWQIPATDA
jgi:GrpB-like predicted nucleotidyltransferase (UPF0157 family)